MSTPHLPNEILDIVCQELSAKGDISNLFNCAVASKRFAEQALQILYRDHSESPASDEDAEGLTSLDQQNLLVQKSAIMWRSITLSSFGETMFPYCEYLRVLDLRDLKGLLEDDRFRGKIENYFFARPLRSFSKEIEYTFTRGGSRRKRTRLDLQPIVESIADVIIAKNSSLEEVSGEFSTEVFQKWQYQLPKLQRLFLWAGDIISSKVVRDGIRDNCPKFNALSMHHWHDEQYDQHLGTFLEDLLPQTMRSLETISRKGVGPQTCRALNRHSESLKELSVLFEPEALEGLSLLKDCRAVERLALKIFPSADLESSHKDVYDNLLAWFGSLTDIVSISLTDFKSAPSLLMPLLLNQSIQLQELHVDGSTALYNVKDNGDFHLALTNQKSLQTLYLKGDGEDCWRDDIDVLVSSLGQLQSLRKLDLRGIADMFGDDPMCRLFGSLPLLEDVYITGFGISDAVLRAIGPLQNLRTITFAGLTSFTFQGLSDLVDGLHPLQEGFFIAVDAADPASLIGDNEIGAIRRTLLEKVHGRLDYIPLRDPDVSEFEGESD